MGPSTQDGSVTFGGLSSGLDSNAIIDAMVKAAQVPLDKIRKQEAHLAAHKQLYGDVTSALTNFATVAGSLDSTMDFGQMAAATTDPSVMQATAGSNAQAGTYNLTVQQLACEQRTYSNTVSDPNAAGLLYTGPSGGSGAIDLTGPQGSLNVPVDATTTLQNVADAINGAGIGASANILFDGQAYRLVLVGAAAGAANAVSISESQVATGLSNAANEAQPASDAQVLLDNFTQVTRPTNVLTDVIPGLTLSLVGASSTPQTVSVSVDTAAVTSQVNNYIAAYNQVVASVHAATDYTGQRDPDRLVGDSALRGLTMDLQALISAPLANQALPSLAAVGVSTQSDGTLALDSAAFAAALAQNYSGVQRLFIFDPTSNTNGVAIGAENLVSQYTDFASGTLTLRTQSIDTQVRSLDTQLQAMQRNLDQYESTLKLRFNQLEENMTVLRSQNAYLAQSQSHPPSFIGSAKR